MLKIDDSVLIVIDVQGRLAQIMHNSQELFEKLQQIVKGCQVLGVPIIWLEQNPLGLGRTIPELQEMLKEQAPICKVSFSCCGNDEFNSNLHRIKRTQVLVTGIETHICVYQTVVDLLELGHEVHLITDAVSSRTQQNRDLAIAKMQSMGAQLSSVEMALFELLKVADDDRFRKILKIIK